MDFDTVISAALAQDLGWAKNPPSEIQRPIVIGEEIFQHHEQIRVVMHHPELAGMSIPAHAHEFYEISFVWRGEFAVLTGSERLIQTPGQLVISGPQMFHATRTGSPNDIVFNILVRRWMMEEVIVDLLSPHASLRRFLCLCKYPGGPTGGPGVWRMTGRHEDVVQQLVGAYYDHGENAQASLLAQLLTLFTDLTAANNTGGLDPVEPGAGTEILSYLSRHYRDTSLNDVAAHFGYSARQLSRIIHATAGRSFPAVVNAHKIDAVCRQLRRDPQALTAAIRTEGFSDIKYFYRVFRRVRGISFSEYKRRLDSSPSLVSTTRLI